MLRNPSFEEGHYNCGIGNCPNEWQIDYMDGITPDDWTAPALAPEIQVPSKQSIPQSEWGMFFRDGDHCLKVFKGDAPIWFALSQTVTGLTPGATYRFTAPVHLDIYEWAGHKVYPMDGYAAEAHAGIGNSWDTVAWTDWQAPAHGTLEFGQYGDVVLEFTADAETVTLWVECKAKWANLSNNFFFDAFTLEQISAPEPEPPPRTYERTYVLLPQDATWDEAVGQLAQGFDAKHTIGFSADDALVAPAEVTRRTVLIPYNRFPGDILEFADEFYPGAEIVLEGEKVRPLPEPEPPPTPPQQGPAPTDGPFLTAHIQSGTGAFENFAHLSYTVKLLEWGEMRAVYPWNNNINFVLRKYWSGDIEGTWLKVSDIKASAYRWIDEEIAPGLKSEIAATKAIGWDGIAWVEVDPNEIFGTNAPLNPNARDFNIWAAHRLMEHNIPNVRPALMTAAVGNPDIPEYEPIVLPMAAVAEQYGGCLAPHPYWCADGFTSYLDEQWPWQAGRHEAMDDVCVAHGVYTNWFLGEVNVTKADAAHKPTPSSSWRADSVYGADWSFFRSELIYLNEKYKASRIAQEGRLLGAALFTTGGGQQWKYFEMAKAQWDDLAVQF